MLARVTMASRDKKTHGASALTRKRFRNELLWRAVSVARRGALSWNDAPAFARLFCQKEVTS